MKIKHPVFFALLFSIATSGKAATYPFQPTAVENYSSAAAQSVNGKRLRLAVSIDGASQDDNVKVGDLIFCSSLACFRPSPINYVTVKSTLDGTATRIFDSLVPYGEIRSIYFGETAGNKTIAGHIELPTPLIIGKDVQGGDILVTMKKKVVRGNTVYIPHQAVSAYLDSGAEVVYYDPALPATVNLPLGVKLAIPVGATVGPQIFSVAVRDVGKDHPTLDIYPYVETKKEFTVTSELNLKTKSATTLVETPPLGTASARSSVSTASVGPITKKFKKTGYLKFSQIDLDGEGKSRLAAPPLLEGNECISILSNPINQNIIEDLLQKHGAVNVNYCENFKPFVHIGLINTENSAQSNYSVSLAYSQKFPEVMNLTPINNSTFLSKSVMTINGFYWAGDEGTGPNQTGRPSGYAKYQNNQIGVNYTAGVSQGLKRIMEICTLCHSGVGRWLDFAQIYNFGDSKFVISSSTSIVKDGVCTTDSLRNRWSAIGEAGGRYVIMSSISDYETSAAELCEFFKALKINNAIRLDGGPSTAITMGPTLVNPLVGLARLKYGNVRHIAYSIKFALRN